ncbi:MAG: enoyl-CoA hydratase/isomerase family protein [Candidatus Obscuribacterales bacterium]|nr:enoyl-CoA hydratase/isomerase family protein [Candidatus Obscuribacterales bacterium]
MNSIAEKEREFLLIVRPSGVALIMLDCFGRYNVLGRNAITKLGAIVNKIKNEPKIKAALLISGKPESFIIGADLQEIRQAKDQEELLLLSQNGQELVASIAEIGKPLVAAINGTCLGGGLELALACHGRVATNEPETIIGLPETKIGLIPGLGGTQRLPRIIGLKSALELILSGDPISAEQAFNIGLVDKLVASDYLIDEAESYALQLLESGQWQQRLVNKEALPAAVEAETGIKATSHCKVGLNQEQANKLLKITERAVRLRTKGNYPAQLQVLEAIKEGLLLGLERGMNLEAKIFSELAASKIAANLISLSINTEIAKQQALSLCDKYPQAEVETVAIIGAGKMGMSLATLSAANGLQVIVRTGSDKIAAVKEDLKVWAQKISHYQKSQVAEADDAVLSGEELLASINVTDDDKILETADLILECVKEDLEIKKTVLSRSDQARNEDSTIASNTSGLSIADLSRSVSKPENFIGLHFFHPVDRMPLVEIVSDKKTNKHTIARAAHFVSVLDKIPLIVKDGPGFLINRLLTAYLVEFSRMMSVAPLNWIEAAAIDFGMPIGPMQLMDEIGIDVALSVANNLQERIGKSMTLPNMFYKVRDTGVLGRKSGTGFYVWEGDKKQSVSPEILSIGCRVVDEPCPPEEKLLLAERLILPMIDEAACCLEERIVSRPREIDVAVVLAFGFPSFRGGLLRYADSLGIDFICQRLEHWYANPDNPREVSKLLRKYQTTKRNFYSLSAGKED